MVVAILLVLPLALFWQTTLGNRTLIPADNLYQWEPWASYADEMGVGVPHNELLSDLLLENYAWKRFLLASFRQPGGLTNRLPLWNPYLWAGTPFLADGQHSALYPFSLVFYLLPLPQAYGWFTVLQFWLAGVSMYVLARTLGASRVGGLLAGIVYQLSSVYVVSTVFTMIIAAMAWLPLLLAAIEMVIRQQMQGGSGKTVLYAAGGALALGCQMLAGHPEITYYTALVMGVYALSRLGYELSRQRHSAARWVRGLRSGLWLALMAGMGASIGAAQLVPLYELVSVNFRQGSESYETIIGWAFKPRRLIAFFVPNFFGNPSHHTWFDILRWRWVPVGDNILGEPTQPAHTIYWGIKNAVEGGSYVGIMPHLLAVVAVLGGLGLVPAAGAEDKARASPLRRRFYVWFFLLLALFSLSLVFGLPTYRIVFSLPGINQLHSPFRWLFPYTLSMALLAGFGATYLSSLVQNAEAKHASATLPEDTSVPCHCEERSDKAIPNAHPGTEPSSLHADGDCADVPSVAGKAPARNDRAGGRLADRIIALIAVLASLGGLAGIAGLLAALPFAGRLAPLAERAVHSLAKAETAFASGRMFFMYEWPQLLLFSTMLLGSGAVLWLALRRVRLPPRLGGTAVWAPLAVLLLAVDLLIAGYGFNPAADPAWLQFTPPSIAFLQQRRVEEPPFRVTSFAGDEKTLHVNTPWLYDIEDVRGYGSIIHAQYVDFVSLIANQFELLYNRVSRIAPDQAAALDSPLLDLLGVRYVVTSRQIDSPRYELVYDGEVRIYRNTGALPRAFTMPQSSTLYTADLAATVQDHDPRHYAILEGTTATDPVPAEPGPATVSQYTHNEVLIDVEVSEPSWLVLADSYFPGWRAYVRPLGGSEVDEQSLDIQRYCGNFRAVALQPGTYTVRFKYTPTSVKVGFFASFLGGTILVLSLIAWGWRRTIGSSEQHTDAQRVARNSLAPIVLQLFNKAIDMAFAMLALRILAPERHGQYYFVISIVMYTDVLINFGLNIWLQREIARARDAGQRYLGNAILLRLALCLAAAPLLVLFVVLWPVFARLFVRLGWTADLQTLAAAQVWALVLFAVGLVPTNVAAALTALFQAHERMEVPAAITVVSTIIKAGLGTAALLVGWGIVGLGGVSIATNLITLGILLVLTVRTFWVPRLTFDRGLQRRMLGESWPLMVNNLLSMAFFKADVILLKAIDGDVALGLYSSVAYKVIDAINIIPISFTVALFPLISRYADTSRESMLRAYRLAVRMLVIVALPLALALTALAYPLATVIGGSGYMPDSAIALQLMIWSIPLGFVNSVTHYVLIALGRQRALMATFAVGVTFTILANATAIPVWGYRASAVIHIFSELVLLVAFYVLLRRDLASVAWPMLLWRPALAGAFMGAVGWLLYDVNKLLATVAALAVYAGVLWASGIAREPDMAVVRDLVPRLRRGT